MEEEQDLHINVLEMKTVQVALDVLQRQIMGESVVVMSYNATVVAHTKRHGGSVSQVKCSLAKNVLN